MCGCPDATGTTPVKSNCLYNQMIFWLGILQYLGRRAQSLKERLSNEINLGLNLVVQPDSRETVLISRHTASTSSAARRDSAETKTIAAVTLAFLPATFVCTIFSMSFFTFNVGDESGQKHWLTRTRFWIYWLITVPPTILTLSSWKPGDP
ncbi:hypothetical protein A1O7_06452 [Cladophialophora yegresii CBS 114405]|uniref:Uncharacterized protein n=1 Tax=Cladophialophora yegresii CBS 114405 TaxID=1182544 RepID=W9W3A6_9EURO|nr:uncharacterized protein A1O7_06452 [Cladophialophora yegresii CBS 114405]EXJ59021.1 hypothetical protein A1O7_06452 [Cladophialophora yegresii CBS 114405]